MTTTSAEPSTSSGSAAAPQRRRQITSYKSTTSSPATDTGRGGSFRHCERSEAIQTTDRRLLAGLLRRFAPRNDERQTSAAHQLHTASAGTKQLMTMLPR